MAASEYEPKSEAQNAVPAVEASGAPSTLTLSVFGRRMPLTVGQGLRLLLILLAGLATILGLFARGPERLDPFGGARDLREWFTARMPDRALASVEVVPMGSAGTLSWRPATTAWLFAPLDTLKSRAAAALGAAAPFPQALRLCSTQADLFCPLAAPAPDAATPNSPANATAASLV